MRKIEAMVAKLNDPLMITTYNSPRDDWKMK